MFFVVECSEVFLPLSTSAASLSKSGTTSLSGPYPPTTTASSSSVSAWSSSVENAPHELQGLPLKC